jgi:hypothetical protein
MNGGSCRGTPEIAGLSTTGLEWLFSKLRRGLMGYRNISYSRDIRPNRLSHHHTSEWENDLRMCERHGLLWFICGD